MAICFQPVRPSVPRPVAFPLYHEIPRRGHLVDPLTPVVAPRQPVLGLGLPEEAPAGSLVLLGVAHHPSPPLLLLVIPGPPRPRCDPQNCLGRPSQGLFNLLPPSALGTRDCY